VAQLCLHVGTSVPSRWQARLLRGHERFYEKQSRRYGFPYRTEGRGAANCAKPEVSFGLSFLWEQYLFFPTFQNKTVGQRMVYECLLALARQSPIQRGRSGHCTMMRVVKAIDPRIFVLLAPVWGG